MTPTLPITGRPGPTSKHPRWMVLVAVLAGVAACAPSGEKLLARGEQNLAEGRFRAAMIDFKNFVAKHPEDARARAQLGLAMLELGDVAAAEAEIAKAKSLGAAREVTAVPECRLLIAQDAFDRAIAECTATGKPDVDAALVIVRGDALLGLQRFAEARGVFEQALAARPDSLPALQGLAAAVYAMEGMTAARAVFDAAPKALHDRPRYWLALGSLELRSSEFDRAEAAFQAAAERAADQTDGPDRLSALAGLTETQMRAGKTTEAAATADLLLAAAPKNRVAKTLVAQAALSAGDPARARTLLEEVVSADPGNDQARVLLGLVNFQQGNLGQAEMHLSTVVAQNPDNVRAQRLLAEVRVRLGTPEETLQALKPALQGGSTDPELLTLAGRLSLQSGDRAQALDYLAQASAGAADASPQSQFELASGFLAAGDVDRAVAVLESTPAGTGLQRDVLLLSALIQQGKGSEAADRAAALAKASPDDVMTRSLVAAVYAAVGQRDRARAEYAAVLSLKPGGAETLLKLARLDLLDGDASAAKARLEQVLAGDGRNLAAALGMVVVARLQGDAEESERWARKAESDHPESLEAKLALAQLYLGLRDFNKAREMAEKAVEQAPHSATAFNTLGLAQLGAGDQAAALASLRSAIDKDKGAIGFRLNLARAYALRRDTDQALAVLDEALRMDPKQLALLSMAATVALQGGAVEPAAGYVERISKIAPDAGQTQRLEGDLAMAQKRYKDAQAAYARAAAKGGDASLAVARYRAASLGGLPDAGKPLEEWLARHPDDVGVRIVLGEYRGQRGDDAGAAREYERVISAAPSNPVALNNLAVIYDGQGRAGALELAERAYTAAPESAAIQDTYGWLLVRSGEPEKGVDLLRRAAKSMSNSAEVQYHLAAALAKIGQRDEARMLLERIIASSAPATVQADARRVLAELNQ